MENEAESWLPMQQWLLKLRRKGKAVLFVHHGNKSGKQRGTSRREDILDVVIKLQHPPNYTAESGAEFEVHLEKARGVYGDDARSIEASSSTKTQTDAWIGPGSFWRIRIMKEW